MNPESEISLTVIKELKETVGADFIVELVDTYAEETPKLFTELRTALAEKNCETFRRAAHSIKSTSNSLGALKFGELAKELEYMGRDGDLSNAPKKVDFLAAVYNDVEKNLKDLKDA